MAQPVLMPKLGQTVEESTIVSWHKAVGDTVAKGDILFEIETDKAVLEVESFHEGTLLKIFVNEGETVPVQSVVGYIGAEGDDVPDAPPPPPEAPKKTEEKSKPAPKKAAPAKASAPAAAPVAQAAPVAAAAAPAAPPRFKISPRAKALAKAMCIGYERINGTGPEGRVVEKDVKAYLDKSGYNDLRIAPAAKALAAKEGIDLLSVVPTGDGGRLTVDDVNRAIAEKPVEMSKMRQIIAQRLTQSVNTAPHFYVTVSVDMTDLLAYRKHLKAQGEPYSVTDFVMEAVVLSLTEFPAFNSGTDGKSIWWNGQVNLGLAVSLDSGLVVPVVRNAAGLTLTELHDAAADLIGKAREGKLMPADMSGSTFTISNMGMLNVENFTAIINPGEAGILAVSSVIEQPVVRDGKIVPRSIMKLTLSSDHRIVDGALAAKFANAIKDKLEEVSLWKSLT